jgi:hypothetical protein
VITATTTLKICWECMSLINFGCRAIYSSCEDLESCTEQERNRVSTARYFGCYSKSSSRQVHAHGTPYAPAKCHLVEETNNLSCHVLASCLLMVHDTGRGCEDNVSELTGWQELDNPLLEISETNVVSWGNDTSLVETIISNQQTLSMKTVSNSYRPFS